MSLAPRMRLLSVPSSQGCPDDGCLHPSCLITLQYRIRYRLAFRGLLSFAKEIFQAFQIFNLPILRRDGWIRLWTITSVRRYLPNSQDNADRDQQQPNVKPNDPDAEFGMRLDPIRVASSESCNSNQGDQEIPRSSMHGIEARRFHAVSWSEMMSERAGERLNHLGICKPLLPNGERMESVPSTIA